MLFFNFFMLFCILEKDIGTGYIEKRTRQLIRKEDETMLSDRLQKMYEATRGGAYAKYKTTDFPQDEWRRKCAGLSQYRTHAEVFRAICRLEEPVILPGDRFFFTRTIRGKDWRPFSGHPVENLTADWEILLSQGIDGRIAAAEKKLRENAAAPECTDFLTAAIDMLNEAKRFSLRYAEAAERSGDAEGAALLRKVPAGPASTLREALQSVFFMFSMFHHSGVFLQGLGRMDQYLLPYYEADLRTGRLTREQAGELISEFFIMLNRENEIYGNVQRGDDGESVMLGGCRRDGSGACSDLTKLILECSYDVAMINPKINLRVDSNTPREILEAGVRLTGRGLGFPQYANDEIVIPALIRFGYTPEDARDYTVAACWEFVVKNGRDIPNLSVLNLALAADHAIRKALREHLSFEELLEQIKPEIRKMTGIGGRTTWDYFAPNPLFSAFSGLCIERGKDLQKGGGDHYHFGCLSAGSSTAADSLCAVKHFVYDTHEVAPERLLRALETNYRDDEELRLLMKTGPKTGDNDPESNRMLKKIFDDYCDVLEETRDNGLGGRIRPGTGSAQFYALMTQRPGESFYLSATADGRKEGEYISSSLAPAPGVRSKGVLSVLQTYGSLDYNRLCNGGPITMEFSPAFFKTPDAVSRTVSFVRAFVRTGCQQIQMNVLDREVLLDAKAHPERHRDLIVRVWGWSGYFVELDPIFQNQIIGRQTFEG